MNQYRFRIKSIWPTYIIQKMPNIDAAIAYAKANEYDLMRHLDADSEFISCYFKQNKTNDSRN